MIKGFFQKTMNLFQDNDLQLEVCKHNWEVIAKTYAPPVKNLQTVIQDLKLLEKAVFGITTCIWICKLCGEMKKEEMLGTDENQWLDIVEKVERFGMQYIKENSQVYGVAKWVPPLTETRISVK